METGVEGLVLGLADGGHVGGHQNPPALEQLPGDGPGEHQRRRKPAGEVAAAPDVVVVSVLHIGGVVGVAGPGQHPQAAVILGALVGVLDDGAQGRAGGDAIQQAAEHLGGCRPPCGWWRWGPGRGRGGAICPSTCSQQMGSPAGRPSIFTPMARVWLPPKMEMRIFSPQVEDMGAPS